MTPAAGSARPAPDDPVRPVPPRLPASLVGARVAQYLADSLVLLPVWLAALYVAVLPLVPGLGPSEGVAAVALVLLLVVTLGVFFVLVPVRTGGQTVAMRWCGLRVVSLDGSVPTARQHVVRLLGLVVDGSGNGLVGLLTVLLTARRQRVGDLLAGTTVVWDEAPRRPVGPRERPGPEDVHEDESRHDQELR